MARGAIKTRFENISWGGKSSGLAGKMEVWQSAGGWLAAGKGRGGDDGKIGILANRCLSSSQFFNAAAGGGGEAGAEQEGAGDDHGRAEIAIEPSGEIEAENR
jgi:hypothetical protein